MSLYDFYSYEMGEKLDEIADKYGLKLHTDIEDVVSEEWDGKVGGHFLKEGCKAEWGYMISDINAFRIFLNLVIVPDISFSTLRPHP